MENGCKPGMASNVCFSQIMNKLSPDIERFEGVSKDEKRNTRNHSFIYNMVKCNVKV